MHYFLLLLMLINLGGLTYCLDREKKAGDLSWTTIGVFTGIVGLATGISGLHILGLEILRNIT